MMNIIGWFGWTKDDWKEFVEELIVGLNFVIIPTALMLWL